METVGRVLHRAWWYDVTAWLWSRGKEREFRERLVSLASLRSGESVLDVGCGTGTMALAMKKRVGPDGAVVGIDASSEMIRRARWKTRRAGLEISFENAVAEELPFPDSRFDAVFSTLVLHHLPAKSRKRCLVEIRRVLKANGRVLIADFETSADRAKGIVGLIHRQRHGHVAQTKIPALVADAHLSVVGSGIVGFGDVHYTIAVPGAVTTMPDRS